MFPNYRRSATQRRESLLNAGVALLIVASLLFAGTCFYVVAHFVVKYW